MHGVLTQREWISRRNSARLRVGSTRLSLKSWAGLLSEGALQSFLRLERVEENGLMRSSSRLDSDESDTIKLDGVSAERGEHVVLEDLNLRVNSGECVMVCGPSELKVELTASYRRGLRNR